MGTPNDRLFHPKSGESLQDWYTRVAALPDTALS